MPRRMPAPKSKFTRKHAIAGAIFLALAFALGAGIIFNRGSNETAASTDGANGSEAASVVDAPSDPAFRDALSGLPLPSNLRPSDPSNLPRVYAVMIDNSVDAWPQSGIDKAFLVIEAPVEAAIPRFEAFFSADSTVEKIGPVRSARPYFVDWANEFDALYAHVGGSNDALALIGKTGTFDLNEFSHGNSFWRATDRSAPHNAYTSTELLGKAVEKAVEKGTASDVLYGVWKFKDGTKGGGAAGAKAEGMGGVSVRFNSDLYLANWTYDPATNTYLRSQGGRKTVTQDGTRVSANNVAVIVTDVSVLDAVGRRKIRTTGEGKAWVLQDGATIDATWKKSSASERLAFYDKDGNEIAMNAGNTWIEVAESEGDVTRSPS